MHAGDCKYNLFLANTISVDFKIMSALSSVCSSSSPSL